MKKSIIVMMVAVLLISALFVSCKQEIATPQDSLGTVQVSLPSSRTLTPGTPTSNIPEVTNWYYVAHKESGYYNTGEQPWGDLAAMASGQQVGEKFSAGLWTFSFYGYASAKAAKPDNPTEDAIYYATVSNFEVKGQDDPNYIDVTLQGGAIPAATVTFQDLTFGNSTLPGSYVVKINGEVATFTGGKCTFTNVAEGEQTYKVTVWTSADGEMIGEAAPVTIAVSKGYDYTISGVVDPTESLGIVIIDKVEYQKSASQSKSVTSGQAVTFNTFVAPDGSETSVAFGTDSGLAGDITLTTKVSGSESAGAFVIKNVGSSVASIDLSLSGSATSFSGTATVTTKIAKGLNGVVVKYNGTGADPTDVIYNELTGELSFKTTHFSQFVVVSSDEIIVSDGTAYATLAAFATAVNDGNSFAGKTVYLMKDVSLSGTWTPIGTAHRKESNPTKVFSGTFDGKGHTISGLSSEGYTPAPSTVDLSEYTYGLFGYVKNGTVRNVTLTDVAISQSSYQLENAGGVVGYLDGGKVENCAVSGSVSGWNGIGGIVGRAYGTCTIQNCTNSATVSGKKNVAGVVGFVNPLASGTIKVLDNSNSGYVTRVASSEPATSGAAAGIACYGCSDSNVASHATSNLYITGNTNSGVITNSATARIGDIHFLTSHGPTTTTGHVEVQ